MRPRSCLGSLLLALSLGACATTGPRAPLAQLEQRQRAEPGSFAANRSLGIAYYRASRFAEARGALEAAARLAPRDGTTALYLGLTTEALGDLTAAKGAYSSYLAVGRTNRVRRQLKARLTALSRRELAVAAREAVRQEQALGAVVGPPSTVAVMPLRFSGADSSLRPLERGFAELLTTDLARSSKLTVVERSRMQALLDEIALQRDGHTDAGTSVRAGRLLRAGRVVQGSLLQIGGSQLRVDAAIVDVPTTEVRGGTQGSDELEQLFALEKRIALDLFRELGITLTVAERNAIEQRPTRSLAAFLAYSRGLVAEDQGRYDDASRYYREARRIDPGFGAARQRERDAGAVVSGSEITMDAVESSLRGTPEGVIAGTGGGLGDDVGKGNGKANKGKGNGSAAGELARETAGDLNPSTANAATAGSRGNGRGNGPPKKDDASAATNTDSPGKSGKVKVVITRPKKP